MCNWPSRQWIGISDSILCWGLGLTGYLLIFKKPIQSIKYVASIYKIAIKRAERVQCQETDDMVANFFFTCLLWILVRTLYKCHNVCVCVCVCRSMCVHLSHRSIVGYNKVYQRMLQMLKLNSNIRDYCICKEWF